MRCNGRLVVKGADQPQADVPLAQGSQRDVANATRGHEVGNQVGVRHRDVDEPVDRGRRQDFKVAATALREDNHAGAAHCRSVQRRGHRGAVHTVVAGAVGGDAGAGRYGVERVEGLTDRGAGPQLDVRGAHHFPTETAVEQVACLGG